MIMVDKFINTKMCLNTVIIIISAP